MAKMAIKETNKWLLDICKENNKEGQAIDLACRSLTAWENPKEEKLTPCSCGGEVKVIDYYINGTANLKHYFCKCKNCGKRVKPPSGYASREKAIAEWNNETGKQRKKVKREERQVREEMTAEVFERQFGIRPEKAKELMERLQEIVTEEVRGAIRYADFYVNPRDYTDPAFLRAQYGANALDKDDDEDGYPNLYDYKKEISAEQCFMEFISSHTRYGGYGSAIDACQLMGMEGWRE